MRSLLTRLRDPSHAENDEPSSLGDLCREAAAEIDGLYQIHRDDEAHIQRLTAENERQFNATTEDQKIIAGLLAENKGLRAALDEIERETMDPGIQRVAREARAAIRSNYRKVLPKSAAAEIERLQYVIDLARTGLLRVERLSEETRAAITQAHA
jgi:transcription initiation factor TFIIIB Brf1 subunit/transcription initiation factor TFIIB